MADKVDRQSPRNLRISLMVKLMGAFMLVIVISALLIYFLTTQAMRNAFRLYTTQNSQLWAERLAPDFGAYYAQANTWQGVEVFIQSSLSEDNMPEMMNGMGGRQGGTHGMGRGGLWMGGMGQRLILTDALGKVIADTADAGTGNLTGSQLSADELSSGAKVIARDQLVGTLIATPANILTPSNPASTFLTSVNRSILISVLVASLISLFVVLFIFIQITAPIRQMQRAASEIANGNLSQRVVVHTQDELGELAHTFNHMASSLASAEAQRKNLLADVAHELRTPLAVIQANTEAMQDGVLPIDLEQVNAIHNETLLLGRLVNDLRLISLAEAGELHLERQVVDPAGLLQNVAERFQPQCDQKGIALALEVEDNLPQLSVDVDRMVQVLNNLVNNGLRYTPEGGKIILQAARASTGGNEVEICVTDSGSGIAAADLPWVFDRFYRTDKSRARLSGGSGLGLAIVKNIVEAHQGRVWASSPVFQDAKGAYGTRISFTLPGE